MNLNANFVLSTLESHGYKAYLVGGCVRDMLLGKMPVDYDITTDCLPETVETIFSKTLATGKKFGTITVILTHSDGSPETFEVTTFRHDQAYSDGRRPTAVLFSKDLESDVQRRDFTINAMAMDINGRVYDYHKGQEDLENKRLMTVGDPDQRFTEDYLRMFRGIRFSATLDFDLDPSVAKSILAHGANLHSISKERLKTEMTKLLLSDTPYKGLQYMHTLSLWQTFFKDIDYHRIDKSSINNLDNNLLIRLVYIYFENDTLAIEKSMASFKLPKKIQARIRKRLLILDTINSCDHKDLLLIQKRALLNISRDEHVGFLGLLEDLYQTVTFNPYHNNKDILANYEAIIYGKFPLYINDLAIDGNDLRAIGIQGAAIGKTLSFLQEQVLVTPSINATSQLLALAQRFSCDSL